MKMRTGMTTQIPIKSFKVKIHSQVITTLMVRPMEEVKGSTLRNRKTLKISNHFWVTKVTERIVQSLHHLSKYSLIIYRSKS